MRLERKTNLSIAGFTNGYLAANRPVVVADAVTRWPAFGRWTPDFLATTFGDEKVLVYDDLFMLVGMRPLRAYLERYFGEDEVPPGQGARRPTYVRWYTRSKADPRIPWADAAFERLRDDWELPYFAPDSNYILPFCPPDRTISPRDTPFPARALFISARGARTRLHADPWGSDAILCQLHGRKSFVMYPPDQASLLTAGGKVVDVANPDIEKFPDFAKARPAVEDELAPGEAVFIPAGWYHHFDTLENSISLTWNFVHMSRQPAFTRYLAGRPPQEELDTIQYFLYGAPVG